MYRRVYKPLGFCWLHKPGLNHIGQDKVFRGVYVISIANTHWYTKMTEFLCKIILQISRGSHPVLFLLKVLIGVNKAETQWERIHSSDPVQLRQKKEKKKSECWISQGTLSIQPFPSFLQYLSFVSGWWREAQSWQRMLTRRPCRNPPEWRRECLQDRVSQPQTPRRRRPKTLQLFWRETILQ